MIQNFQFNNGLVFAEVVNVPGEDYFFVKNGEPKNIMCHVRQGGRLDITPNGRLVIMKEGPLSLPCKGDRVVLIRESNNPGDRLYTKAKVWIREIEWHNVKWAVNIDNTYRAIGFNHRVNGQFTSTNKNEIVLVIGTLKEIIGMETRNIKERYQSGVGDLNFSCEVRWERLAGDAWVECLDPRPENHK